MKKYLGVLLVVAWLILPQIALEIIGSKASEHKLSWPIAIGSILALLPVQYFISRYFLKRFFQALDRRWIRHKNEKENGPSLITFLVVENGDKRFNVIPEYLLDKASGGIICFSPASLLEKEEIFDRIHRISFPLLEPEIPEVEPPIVLYIRLRDVSKNLHEIVLKEVSDLIDDPFYNESIARVHKALIIRRVALLIDATAIPFYELKEWWSVSHYSLYHTIVLAIKPFVKDDAYSAFGRRSFIVSDIVSLNRIREISKDILSKGKLLAVALGLEEQEVLRYLRFIGFSFLKLRVDHPDLNSYFLGEVDPNQKYLQFITYLQDWINITGDESSLQYSWKQGHLGKRDYLAAQSIFQGEQSPNNAFLEAVNKAPYAPYVRPFLDYFANKGNGERGVHALSGFKKEPIHFIVEKLFDETPQPDSLFSKSLSELGNALAYLEQPDIFVLIKLLIEIGDMERLKEMIVKIPSCERISTIVSTKPKPEQLIRYLESFITDADLWNYFEAGMSLDKEIYYVLEMRGSIDQIIRLSIINLLAPHSSPLDEHLVERLKEILGYQTIIWEHGKDIPYERQHIELVVKKVQRTKVLLGQMGEWWIQRLQHSRHICSLLTDLYDGLTAIDQEK